MHQIDWRLEVKVHCNDDILSYLLPEMCGYGDNCVKYPGAVAIETEGTGILSLKITLGVLLCLLGDMMVIQE